MIQAVHDCKEIPSSFWSTGSGCAKRLKSKTLSVTRRRKLFTHLQSELCIILIIIKIFWQTINYLLVSMKKKSKEIIVSEVLLLKLRFSRHSVVSRFHLAEIFLTFMKLRLRRKYDRKECEIVKSYKHENFSSSLVCSLHFPWRIEFLMFFISFEKKTFLMKIFQERKCFWYRSGANFSSEAFIVSY